MITLDLVHPIHGVVQQVHFKRKVRKDTKQVLKIVDRWRKKYGKKFLECENIWSE